MTEKPIQVLLIEDSRDFTALVKDMLGRVRDRRFALTCADRLETGLQCLHAGKPDAILLDLMLPDARGAETFVRTHREAPHIPIVVLTSLEEKGLGVQLVQQGAADYLLKKEVTGELVARAVLYTIERHRLATKKRVQDLQAGQARLLKIVERNADAIVVVDQQGAIRFVNPSAETLLGRPKEELLNAPFGFPVSAHEARELVIKNTAGERFVEMHVVDLDWEGAPAFLASLRDITRRKQAEEALRQAHRELELRVQERTADLAKANEELEAFSFSVSHDLRVPLRHIRGYADLLHSHAGSVLDEKGRQYLAVILKSEKRMGALIDDLLRFSRIGRAELHKRVVQLGQLVQEVLAEVRQDAQARPISWVVGTMKDVQGDPGLLRQVLVNLIDNAIKYTRPRDQAIIEIGCLPDTTETVLFVRDNGVGFDMKYAGKLFGVFQRLHSAEEFEGTGIGLANVSRIVHRHGGRVWAEGAVGQGATFYCAFPPLEPVRA